MTTALVSQPHLNAFVQAVAGTLAAILSLWLTYPILTITTCLQSAVQVRSRNSLKYDWDFTKIKVYFRSFQHFLKFYAGVWPATIATILSTFIYMIIYELLKATFVISNKPTFGEFSTCAFIAGIATSTFVNPFWVIHAEMLRQSTLENREIGFMATSLRIWQVYGYIGFLKGMYPSYLLAMNAPLQTSIFDYFTNSTIANAFNGNVTFLERNRCALLSKFVPSVLLYPFILVRTRLYEQVNGHSFNSMITEIGRVLGEKHGFFGFYKGLFWKLLQSLITIVFSTNFKSMFSLILGFICGLDSTLAIETADRSVS